MAVIQISISLNICYKYSYLKDTQEGHRKRIAPSNHGNVITVANLIPISLEKELSNLISLILF